MKIRIGLLISALTFAGAAGAAMPTYRDARKVYDEIESLQYQTGLWYKKSLAERRAAVDQVTSLQARTERMWPGRSQCKEAAAFAADYVVNLNSFALILQGSRQPQPSDLYAALFNAVTFGEKRASCYDEVEALDQVKK